jgi:hypothetical protein
VHEPSQPEKNFQSRVAQEHQKENFLKWKLGGQEKAGQADSLASKEDPVGDSEQIPNQEEDDADCNRYGSGRPIAKENQLVPSVEAD